LIESKNNPQQSKQVEAGIQRNKGSLESHKPCEWPPAPAGANSILMTVQTEHTGNEVTKLWSLTENFAQS
jgi:hypothetical protein